jgi:hypothetical protein
MTARSLAVVVVICALALSVSDAQQNSKVQRHSAPLPNGAVPDERTAISVAEAVLIPIYGSEIVRTERPYKAILHDDTWTVTGTMQPAPAGMVHVGGVGVVEISKSRGCIERITHSR